MRFSSLAAIALKDGGGGDAMFRKIRLNMRNRTKATHVHVLFFRIVANISSKKMAHSNIAVSRKE